MFTNKLRSVLIALFCLSTFAAPVTARADSCADASCSEYLVKFARQASEADIGTILQKESLEAVYYSEASRIYRLRGDSAQIQKDVLRELNAEETVMYAEPDYEIKASAVPNDPRYPDQWALHNTGQYDGGVSGIDIGMEAVWDTLGAPEPVVVAVLDSGVDYRHEDLAANMWHNPGEIPGNGVDDDRNGYADDDYGYDFASGDSNPDDDYFHGTHVAGTIGAVGDNGIGVTGVNWDVQIMALKFMGSNGIGSLGDAIEGIDYAVANGAKIINNSWDFYYAGTSGLPTNPLLEPVQSLRDAIAAADSAGVIFVAAAGNDGMNDDAYPTYPGSYSVNNIISVAATDIDDTVPAFSNYGKVTVDIGAPGVLIESTYPTWKETPPYHFLSGTSMATPHVSGAAALLWAKDPSLTHREVIDYILQGALPINDLQGKSVTGGRLDLAETFALASTNANHLPVANAGAAQYRKSGETITLKGTATDADGDAPLTYRWTLASPANETQSFSGAEVSFTAELIGTYTATLAVSDAEGTGNPSTVLIYVSAATAVNHAPTASAGPDQLRHVGDNVLLQGKGSDTDGDSLTYKWTLTVPSGSRALLSSTTSAQATFTADVIGTYSATLTVSDGKTSTAATAKTFVQTQTTSVNHAPTATAGPNQLRRVGDKVLLQGKGTDTDGDPLTYKWTLIVPSGSRSVLTSGTSATASFIADVLGIYSATLTVSDGKTSSAPSTSKIYVNQTQATVNSTADNVRYVTGEGQDFPDQTVTIDAQMDGTMIDLDPAFGGQISLNETVLLDGSASRISASDAPLDYEWILVEKPVGSETAIEDSAQVLSRFVPDFEGRYTVQLVVNSGKFTLYGERAFLATEAPATAEDANEGDAEADEFVPSTTETQPPVIATQADTATPFRGGCSLVVD